MKLTPKTIAKTAALMMATTLPMLTQNVAAETVFGFDVEDSPVFPLTRPAGNPDTCAGRARGSVRITAGESAELLEVTVKGMPKNSEVDVFAIQVPNFPFGMSWYIGDIETDSRGRGTGTFIGRFNEETFIVAPNSAIAPQTHDHPIADAATNPKTAPVHTYHIGIWANSPEDAAQFGCADFVTPFNGEHNAGIQLLNTGLFPDEAGPLLDPTLPE